MNEVALHRNSGAGRGAARTASGPNRSILKAFYTQYVSVLLIMLTFTVGAFQRTNETEVSAPLPEWQPPRTLATMEVSSMFASDGSIQDEDGTLGALAEIAKSHDIDIEATVRLRRFDLSEGSAAMRRGLLRAETLERYFEQHDVPKSALSVILAASPDKEEVVSFRLVSERSSDE
jgi:hypothetical protein